MRKPPGWVAAKLISFGLGHAPRALEFGAWCRNDHDLYGTDRDHALMLVRQPIRVYKGTRHYTITTLILLPGAVVHIHRHGRKCRTDVAYVEKIVYKPDACYDPISGKRSGKVDVAYSGHDCRFEYRSGDIVLPQYGFDPCPDTCAGGIHFFFNRDNAVQYNP